MALKALMNGRFAECESSLLELVSEGDIGSIWLLQEAEKRRVNPPSYGWDGIIDPPGK